jgi:transcription-repair coupling factor (superfamily II helicase)
MNPPDVKIHGLPTTGAKAFYLIDNFYTRGKPVICVLNTDETIESLEEDLKSVVLLFDGTGAPTVFTYPEDVNKRLVTLHRLINKKFDFLLTTTGAVSKNTISRKEFSSMNLNVDGVYRREDIAGYLVSSGYTRMDYVDTEGEYSIRGEILDVWAPNSNLPLRLVFDEDRIESIRYLDIESQRSIEFIDSCEIIPAAEFSDKGSIADYLPDLQTTVFVDEDIDEDVEILPWRISAGTTVKLDRIAGKPLNYQKNTSYMGNFSIFVNQLENWQKEKIKPVIFCDNQGQQERLLEMFEENNTGSMPPVYISKLNSGFYQPDKRLCVLCYHEIFTLTGKPVRFPKFKTGRVLEGLWEISPGDYVVHEKYGIGRYRGLKKITIADNVSEYLTVEYRGGDKLYVPIVDFHKVQKYIGVEGRRPRLYSMDTVGWEHAKKRARKSANGLARQLYDIYASRKKIKGYAFSEDGEFENTLAASFMYNETHDQIRAVKEVKKDMQTSFPMDRLVLGDVGFGKTEVAVRATFKCILSSKQVGVLAPTTVLAEQHYQTFTERFSSFPVKIALLSRFQVKSEQKKIIADIKKGIVDVAIGTHRLLQPDVSFKDLGLVVIDDEHRFGVRQKEKIKLMKLSSGKSSPVDTLSLTATPIPRTLSMALSGIKDISLIESPPEGRFEVDTYIGQYDISVVKQAIRAEVDRRGQVFYLHNYIHSILARKKFLENLLPDIKFGIVHGRMKPGEIEKIMWEFTHKKIDCLIATTIIEAGLDIPNVNTMVIEKAEEFGLAQLYQLRGRVGRGQRKAHCYLFYSEGKLTEDAEKRLQAVYEFAKLGSGFKLALRDMEIRGAGEVLGSRQHGFVQDVGLNLYCQFISQSISQLKGEGTKERTVPLVDVNIPAYIPQEYIPQDEIRITFYRKFMSAKDKKELHQIQDELEDRFGAPPEPLHNLVSVMELRLLMSKLHITQVKETDRYILFKFESPDMLRNLSKLYRSKFKFSLEDNTVVKVSRAEVVSSENSSIQFLKLFCGDLVNIYNNMIK